MGSSWVQGGSEGLLHVPALGSRQYKTNWSAYFLGWRPQSPRVRITVDATKQSLDSTAKDGEGHWKWQRTSTKVTGQEKQHPLQTSVRKKPEEDEGWGPGEMGYWKNPGLPGLPYQPHQWTIQPITSWWHSVSERILNHLFLKKEIFNFPQQVCQSQGKKKKFLTAGSSQPRRGASCWATGSPVQISWIIQALLRGFFIPTETARSHSAGMCSRQSLASQQIRLLIH